MDQKTNKCDTIGPLMRRDPKNCKMLWTRTLLQHFWHKCSKLFLEIINYRKLKYDGTKKFHNK